MPAPTQTTPSPELSALPPWIREVVEATPDAFTTVDVEAGAVLFEQGDPADALFVVLAGALTVCVRHPDGAEAEIARPRPGEVLGEMGLLMRQPRVATARATAPSRLLRLDPANFDRVRTADPSLVGRLTRAAVPRWQRALLATSLRRLFGAVDVVAQHDLAHRLRWQTLASGDVLCRQGDSGDSMWVVMSGRVLFETERPDGTVDRTGGAGPGETVGEFALLTDAPRMTTVVAARQTAVVEIRAPLFAELVAAHPQMLFEITRITAERQRRLVHRGRAALEPATLTITVLPTQPGLYVRPVADALADALRPLGRVRVVDAGQVDAALGPNASITRTRDPLDAALVQWLNEQERGVNYVVFVPTGADDAWTHRCLSRSDRALFVARPGAPAELGPVERALADSPSRIGRDLVLWHPGSTAFPSGTARWLAGRDGYRLHHVREGDPAHTARLGRHVAGRAVGLVLSGGGARGFAHVGAMRAFEESGVPIDAVGGASSGALVGALIARGLGTADLMERCGRYASNKLIFDRTLPLVALNASHRLTATCRELYEDWQIEDLWVPFFSVAVDLLAGQTRTVDRGPVWRAVRTSISVPGVFAPVVDGSDILIDGGVLNNFPVDLMAEHIGSDRLVGIDLTAAEHEERAFAMDTGVSGWRVLRQRLSPFQENDALPFLGEVIAHALFVGSRPKSVENAARADLMIPLSLPGLSLLDFEPYEQIVQAGYDQARGPVQAWAARQRDLAPPQ